jgi:soluble lytic murein transglycosylase-like protein
MVMLLARRTLLFWLVAACATIFICLLATPDARADYAVLRNGQRLHVTSYERLGDAVRLDLPGGSVTVPASDLAAIEPEEVFPPNPPSPPTMAKLDVPYADEISAAAKAFALDPKLIASVIAVESNFNWKAVSPKLSFGLMQLQPKTAAELAVGNVFDPQQNISGGARYLRQLLDHYGQDLVLALAAYNVGPDRVQQYRGVPPFRETHDYIQRVTDKLRESANSRPATSSLSLLP